LSDLVLFGRGGVGRLGLEVVIGPEERELAVVERAVQLAEPPDLGDELVLCGGLLLASGEVVKIAERRDEDRVRQRLRHPLVLLDRAGRVAAGGERAAERAKRAVVAREGGERVAG